jgi:hypothetical protein
VKLKCPECRHMIPMPEGRWPEKCEACGLVMDLPDDNVIAMPFLGSIKTKLTDGVYRDLEKTSEHRAQLAADAAGVPVSEMSDLKLTNIRDTREGEVAAIPVNNSVTQQMDLIKARGGQTGFGATVDMGAIQGGAITIQGQTVRGIEPNAGARTRKRLQDVLTPIGMAPEPLEVTNPGYRKRV